MKRIIIFSTAYYPFVGGAEVAIKEITDRLPDYEFDMITALMDRKLPKREKIGKVNVFRVGFGIPQLDKAYLALCGHFYGLKQHRKKPYIAVWAMMASFGGFAALSFKLKAKIPYLLTLQEGDPIEEILDKVKFIRTRFNKIFTKADGLQALSAYLYNWGAQMGFKGKVSEVVPNGVDVGIFTKSYTAEEIASLRKSFGFAEDAKITITASRLVVKNGVGDVIKALNLLPENYCFCVCGVGELEVSLKGLVKELDLEKRVIFLGYKSHAELPKILKSCDIFIRPSITEGLGNSFLEAMASGLPTLGTLVGGIPDFLTDNITGFACEPKNAESIARAIYKAGNLSQEEKNRLHQNAMKIINEKYNWEYIAMRMDYIFNKLIA